MPPPKELLVPLPLPDCGLIQRWLESKRGELVKVLTPERGVKYQLLRLGQENALAALSEHVRRQTVDQREADDLQVLLGLPQAPNRIEGFDISNTMGTHSVASMVVWEEGRMKKRDYRRFKVKTVVGANDFASMKEIVGRRYGGTLSIVSQKGLPFPDLILIDGGLGQLEAARNALNELNLSHIPIAGLAKAKGNKEERIFLPGLKDPIILSDQSPASLLVQRIRDEAHRFAVSYHRKLRGQALIVPPARKRAGLKEPSSRSRESKS